VLKYIDPLGRYVVDCTGQDATCQTLAAQFETARQEALKDRNEGVRNAALAYGEPGDANGITVAFGNPGDGAAASFKGYIQGHEDGTFSVVGTVTVDHNKRGTELIAGVAHEGEHILQSRAFAATFTPNGTWDNTKNLTRYDREFRAYILTHGVYTTANQPFSTGCRGCDLGRGVGTNADRDRAIRRILADHSGNYNVTAKKPGGRQLPEWE